MCKSRNFLIAFAWCWASAFTSLLIMADNGTFAVEDLPVHAFMATIALFVGPLFFAAGLFGHGGSPIVFPVALISYVVYIVLPLEGRLFQEPVDSLRLPEHHNDWRIYRVARREELNLTERSNP